MSEVVKGTAQTDPAKNMRSLMLPLLASYTHEDKEAKGLRAFSEEEGAVRLPIHFTAAEMVSMFPHLLLHAPDGGGKSSFARSLTAFLSTPRAESQNQEMPGFLAPAYRNGAEDRLAQEISLEDMCAVMSSAEDAPIEALSSLAEGRTGSTLFILDNLDKSSDPEALLAELFGKVQAMTHVRLLVLCESHAFDRLRRPAALPAYGLLGLARGDREKAVKAQGLVDPLEGEPYVLAGLWGQSVQAGKVLSLRSLADLCQDEWTLNYHRASTLDRLNVEDCLSLVSSDLDDWLTPLALFCEGLDPADARISKLVTGLTTSSSDLAVLLAASALAKPGGPQARSVAAALAHAIKVGGAPLGLRRLAGEAMARLGDPRDLEGLVSLPDGTYPMGGAIHPNSEPAHEAPVASTVQIGIYPVTNAAYLRFVKETGREWKSENGRAPSRSSHPATDLTWHDARAYCLWLTSRWRRSGKIGATDIVRLPTEREWEAASRGPQGLLYPWGDEWAAEHSNSEEAGYNDICTVGLFPEGASPIGCQDMAGQAWEWCTTLWGPDMSKPDYAFPWTDDGREALDAAGTIRRVLRGGCFSSPAWKANGVYRGSLEPAGFWRGNGFRIVIADSSC
ncbi:formylglycine-generating enzyme family protein [uncultured Cohaesibacter sp.]|uniref:formylglycine-generating enzyme family protein n=1 Tax=uncultured Cohaesibacter sp. TaxID=1002546 RepID=UPI0029C79F97|nr:formylglycine-generating enzyme family protein [uncultured Cohaesibacter sp.]